MAVRNSTSRTTTNYIFAKKSRNWDYYAKEKMAIIGQLDACNNEDGNEMCNNCDCWKLTREYCS